MYMYNINYVEILNRFVAVVITVVIVILYILTVVVILFNCIYFYS